MILDNITLYTKFLEKPSPKANVIITHGIAESSQEYIELAKTLHLANYNVLLYDVRGHGLSEGKRGDVKDFFLFTSDLHQLVNRIKEKNDYPIYLLGHSMGAVISNCYALKYKDIAGVISCSSPVLLQKKVRKIKFIYKFLFFKRLKTNFNDQKLSSIPYEENYCPNRLDSFTLRLAGNILIKGVDYFRHNLPKYYFDCLIISGNNDLIVPLENSEYFYERAKADDKELHVVDNGKHNLFNDIKKHETIAHVINWLNKHTRNLK